MSLHTASPEFSRNYGFWNEAEQQAILDSHVAIAGVGGDGFQLGQKLAMMGVQHFSVADPEVFERENINRVPGARNSTLGEKKAEVFRDTILDINPDADVRVFTDGVTEDNVDDWMKGSTLVYDESELTYLQIGTMVARAARARGIPNVLVMNVGFAAQVTSFHPESKHTFEKIMGIPKDMPLDEVAEQEVDFNRCVPYLPPYLDVASFEAVVKGASLPSIAPGVDQASAIGTAQGFLHMVGDVSPKRPEPVWAPKFRYVDALTGESHDTRFPRASSIQHSVRMLLRTRLGLNVPTSYTEDERGARELIQAQQAAEASQA
jgi:molybdopterin/thiamine biosynthesis adenylyltransferase